MIEKKAFRSISYGLYLITSHFDGKDSGCTVNTFAQVTSEPFQVSVTMNKENLTTETIQRSGIYTATSLSEKASMELIGTFGFHSSRDIDKFESFMISRDTRDIPYVQEHIVARFSVKVTQEIDLGSHVMFIGTVEEAEACSDDKPITYVYYHEVKGGKTPPKAASFIPGIDDASTPATNEHDESSNSVCKFAWRCTVCGHIEYQDELPDDFTCPLCGAGKELFERIKADQL